MTPDVAWEAANFYLVQGENEKALREFRVVIANDPSDADRPCSSAGAFSPDVDVSAARRGPACPRRNIFAQFLTLLEPARNGPAAVQSLERPDANPRALRVAACLRLHSSILIQHKEVDQAVLVWQQVASRFGLTAYLPSPVNLVVNSRFQSQRSERRLRLAVSEASRASI